MTEKKNKISTIWDEIRNLPINMYSIPNQKISMHVTPLKGAPNDSLYLKLKSSAVIVGLEAALDPRKYTIEQVDKYTIIKRADKELFLAADESLTNKASGFIKRID